MSDTPWDGTRKWPLPGVEIWKNPKNKFLVFQLHYSADPKKRDPLYRDQIKSAMPHRQYMQEYELQWDSFEGTPVYPDWKRSVHGREEKMRPEIGLPLLRGWDFGLTPACVIGQLVGDQLRIIKEFVEINMGAERFSSMVLKQCAVLWPNWADKKKDWRDFIDPAGGARKDTDEGTCAGVLAKKGLTPIPGAVAFEARRQSVESFLCRQTKEGPNLLVSLGDCPVLVRGFEGGYRYPEKTLEVEPQKIRPLKDEHSHPHDALQYVCGGINKLTKVKRSRIPEPSYGGYAGKPENVPEHEKEHVIS